MAVQPEVPSRVSFGPYEFDPMAGELTKQGTKLRLQGQPLQILSILIARPGQVVSREELQRRIWNTSSFGDFEHGLNAAVNKLRQTLLDSADQPRYVETIAGRGYRFIGAIQRSPTKPVIEMAPPSALRVMEPAAKRFPLRAAAIWAVAAVAALAIWIAGRNGKPDPPLSAVKFSVAPPAGYAMPAAVSRQSLALSPDGTQLAFSVMDAAEDYSVWVRKFGELEPKQVVDSLGARTMFWSADGQALYVAARGKLRKSALDGSPPQIVGDSLLSLLSGQALRPDALLLSNTAGARELSLAGKNDRDFPSTYLWPNMLPDGIHILYAVFDPAGGRFHIKAGRYGDTAQANEILICDSRAVYAPSIVKPGSGYLLFVRSGILLAQEFNPDTLRLSGEARTLVGKIHSFTTGSADFSVSRNGVLAYQNFLSRSQMVWVDRNGKRVGTLGPGNINVKFMSLSRDGRKVAASVYDAERGANDIWIYDTANGSGRKLVFERGHIDNPVWSPDSKQLAFFRGYDRAPQMFLRGVGDKDREEVLPLGRFPVPSAWHPDGRYLLYSDAGYDKSAAGLSGDLRLIDMKEPRRAITLVSTRANESWAAFSPDANWIAFCSNESGRNEVYVQAFEGGDSPRAVGERIPVSKNGANFLRWRSDGKEIVYIGPDGMIYGVPIKLNRKLEIGAAVPLFRVATEARAALHSYFGFDVSADGTKFLVPELSTAENSSIVVVQNWEALLTGQPR